jgi:hypothetical protein
MTTAKNDGYIDALKALETITFNDLMNDLTANMSDTTVAAACTLPWCGLLGSKTIPNLSATLQGIVPSSLKSIVTFTTISGAITKFTPILYGIVLAIPVLIFIFILICMLCKCTCCSCWSIMCSPICSIFAGICGIIFLIVSFIPSGLVVPLMS